MEAVKVADVHKVNDPSWPADSEMYSLIDPLLVNDQHYEQCICCHVADGVAIIACETDGTRPPGGWNTIAYTGETKDFDTALRSLGYEDIYDDVT